MVMIVQVSQQGKQVTDAVHGCMFLIYTILFSYVFISIVLSTMTLLDPKVHYSGSYEWQTKMAVL